MQPGQVTTNLLKIGKGKNRKRDKNERYGRQQKNEECEKIQEKAKIGKRVFSVAF